MSGSVIGGIKAAATNKDRHGKDFYARIGAVGGKNGRTGGFASTALLCDCERIDELHKKARCAGVRGGQMSRKRKKGQGWGLTH